MRHDTVHTEQIGGLTIKIYHDQDCESPRENENLGTIATWHRRYELGDVQPKDDPADYLASLPKGSIVLPVYMYEHSGITINTSGFSCPWDSGQLGVIHISPEKIRAEMLVKRITKKTRELVIKGLTCEINEYAKYLEGQCYGYVIEDCDGETIDSCWGFIGYEYVQEEARRAAEYEAKSREDKRIADREMYDDG